MSNIQLLGMWSCGQIMVGSAQCAHRMRNTPTLAQSLYYYGERIKHTGRSAFKLGSVHQSNKIFGELILIRTPIFLDLMSDSSICKSEVISVW